MTRHICILGLGDHRNEAIAQKVSTILSGELRCTVASVGKEILVRANEQDICGPGFYPRGLPWQIRVSAGIRKVLRHHARWRWVPFLRQFFQDAAAARIAQKYKPDLMISQGNAVLSSMCNTGFLPREDFEQNALEQKKLRELISHALYYLLVGGECTPPVRAFFPSIVRVRSFAEWAKRFWCRGLWLPEVAIFLDSTPERMRTSAGMENHSDENVSPDAGIEKFRRRYRALLRVFQEYRGGPGSVHIIHTEHLSEPQIIRSMVNIIKEYTVSLPLDCHMVSGTSWMNPPKRSHRVKENHSSSWVRYLVTYLIGGMFRGSLREPFFLFSRCGRRMLREGYSADLLRWIYETPPRNAAVTERIFLGYPLHRALRERAQTLSNQLEKILRRKLSEYGEVSVFSAPCGCCHELFSSLETIAKTTPYSMGKITIVAADADSDGRLESYLCDTAKKLGVSFTFINGSIVSGAVRSVMQNKGPFDVVLCVGASHCLPIRVLLAHLRWVRQFLEWDSVVATDCFTPAAYALAGSYAGLKAHYYSPAHLAALLDYCGFDGNMAVVESSRNAINHVVVTCPQLSLEQNLLRSHDIAAAIA